MAPVTAHAQADGRLDAVPRRPRPHGVGHGRAGTGLPARLEPAGAVGGPGDQYGVSAPVVAGDIIVVVGHDQVIGVDAASGEQAWTVERELGPSTPPPSPPSMARRWSSTRKGSATVLPPAPRRRPRPLCFRLPVRRRARWRGHFDSHLAAFDLETREPSFDPVALDAVSRTGVTVDGTTAFVGANGGLVYAVDLTDGTVAWTVDLGRPVSSTAHRGRRHGARGAAVDAGVPAPDRGGAGCRRWRRAWRLDDDATAAIVSTVAADGSTAYVAFSGSQESSIDAIEIGSGDRGWRARLPRLFDPTASAPPIITDEAIIATDALGVTYALDPATGERNWNFALNQNVFRAAPIAVAGHVAGRARSRASSWPGRGDRRPGVAIGSERPSHPRTGGGGGPHRGGARGARCRAGGIHPRPRWHRDPRDLTHHARPRDAGAQHRRRRPGGGCGHPGVRPLPGSPVGPGVPRAPGRRRRAER